MGVLVFAAAVALDPFKFSSREPYSVYATTTATTSVTVLNTPPDWQTDAQENPESSTSTPTNVGTQVVWDAVAADSNNESYYLLICKTSSTPTARSGLAPVCGGGGGNQWGVSPYTAAFTYATTTYTTLVGDAESNDWYAWICDQNASNPKCNGTYKQGTGNTASPFAVNHRPSFTVFTDDSPKNPGQVVTWSSTASDPDSVGGADQVALFVCKANDFSGTACGSGGTYCSSTLSASNPTCNTTLPSVLQDKNYTSYGYVIDNHNFQSSGGATATNSVMTVSDVPPSISSSSISLLDTDSVGNLTLTVPAGQTTNFKVTFTVTDNNSCVNSTGGNEIAGATIDVYRSGIGQASCHAAGNYNPNNCYTSTIGTSTWNYSCTQTGSCGGSSTADVNWTCTFPLWFLADPTDGVNATDTQYWDQNWLASLVARDDNSATSSNTEAATGNELQSYLAYTLSTTTIPYGAYEPGQGMANLTASTTLNATGNVGMDETLYGDDMCTTYPTCKAGSTTSTIAISNQHYGTSSVAYGSGVAAAYDPGAELEINIAKTVGTTTPSQATGTTWWGIQIPGTITLAGDYTGKNTIIAVKGEAQNW